MPPPELCSFQSAARFEDHRRSRLALFLFAVFQDGKELLVYKERDERHNSALDQVERRHAKQRERRHILDQRDDLRSHGDDRIQGHAVQHGERGQQIYRIESRAEHGDTSRTADAGHDGALLRLLEFVDSRCRQNERASDDEICQIADKRGGGPLYEKLEHDLYEFDHDSGDRTEGERTDQRRKLGEVELVEARRKKWQREVEYVKYAREGGEYADHRDLTRSENALGRFCPLPCDTLKDKGDGEHHCEDGDKHQYIGGVFADGFEKCFFHVFLLIPEQIKNPGSLRDCKKTVS